jgi:copper(I)-binding protein
MSGTPTCATAARGAPRPRAAAGGAPPRRRAPAMRRLAGCLLGLGAALAALAGAAAQAAAPPRVAVSDAWVRGTVEGQTGSGAYLRLTSSADAQLVGASSPVADKVEIHEMREVGNTMTMRAIDHLALPAGRTVALEHGMHVMLIGLKRALRPGQTVALQLHLLDARGKAFQVEVAAPVRPLNTPVPHE